MARFLDFKLVDKKSMTEQVYEFEMIVHALKESNMDNPEKFKVMSVIEKLPKSWEEFALSLKRQKGDITYTNLMLDISVQEQHKFKQGHVMPSEQGSSKVNVTTVGQNDQGILLKISDNLTLQAFSDGDWASYPDSKRSIAGYVLLFENSHVTWKSKKQPTVSKPSSEAEYRAVAIAASKVSWDVRLLDDLGITNLKLVTFNCDNQSALYIAKNPVFHERTKHTELDCHFTRDKVLEGLLQLTYLPTKSQLADMFTKVTPSSHFNSLLHKLGVSSSSYHNLREVVEADAQRSEPFG